MEQVKNPVTRSVIIGVIAASAAIHFLALYLGKEHLHDWRWENVPVHSGLEIAGSFIAFYVAYLLTALEQKGEGTRFNLPIAGAMVGMGVIDGMHSLVHPGALFVWLHSTATFVGGILFCLLLMPKRWTSWIGPHWPLQVFFASLVFSVLSIVFASELPTMANEQGFTNVAVFLNVTGGIFLLIAAIKLLLTFLRYRQTDDLLFVLHCAMFGFAAIMFEQSRLWDITWWGWHILRFLAYAVALWFAISSDSIAQLRTHNAKISLDKQVKQKQGELESSKKEFDISEQKRNALLSCLTDAVIVIDDKGLIALFTPAAESLFNYKANELIGKPIELLMPSDIASKHPTYLKEYKDKGKGKAKIIGQRRQLLGCKASGETFPIELTINTYRENQQLFFVGLIRDITMRIKQEEQIKLAMYEAQRANEAKSDFLANMSHEIRTPMNGIYGTLQLLGSEVLSETGRDYLDKARYSCKNLLTIINDILDYSKIEANKLEIEYITMSISKVVEAISSDMLPVAKQKGIALNVKVDLQHDLWIGDPVRIGQILLNLTSNAIKFTEQGVVSIIITELDNGAGLSIEVTDTGIGMDKSALERLFSRFEQADNTTTREYGGTGLGMAITQSLVSLMGGSVNASSREGQGTQIAICLPLKRSEEINPQEDDGKSALEHLDLADKRILIAEDNDINQMVISAMLELTGAQLLIANNGVEAVTKCDTFKPDLILMDIQMPKMDGVEACQRILQKYSHLPIVALTANVMTEDITHYKNSGFTDHLGKPIEMHKLASVLKRCIG
ncbi:response regulator [Alteromonas sediminis]|uniref:Sensory/regulatory protein RpfC n=1 Tax=Alteromonas sediminis TaxID=2259342 RepID=A0A3N5Y578_9ALTE|nr:ATP-binding protein [Alteromonas sediminis]RPJ65369.1 response regulator [Alteromonas sediminis]